MSLHALTESRIYDEAVQTSVRHLRAWLAASERSYDAAARASFARAHPEVFGHAYAVALRGYHGWRRRSGASDSIDAFARYIARRHQRWMHSHGRTTGIAPCVLGMRNAEPCWSMAEDDNRLPGDPLTLAA
jgi:hypothetical protein